MSSEQSALPQIAPTLSFAPALQDMAYAAGLDTPQEYLAAACRKFEELASILLAGQRVVVIDQDGTQIRDIALPFIAPPPDAEIVPSPPGRVQSAGELLRSILVLDPDWVELKYGISG